MSNTDLAPLHASRSVTRKPNAVSAETARKRRGNGGLTLKVRELIDQQVFQGKARAAAAAAAGLTENAAYQALRKPAVLAYWNQCLQVLRTGERARNIHRLVEIRDAANNMPAVNAIKTLEDITDVKRTETGQRVTAPGVMVVVGAPRERPAIDLDVIEITQNSPDNAPSD